MKKKLILKLLLVFLLLGVFALLLALGFSFYVKSHVEEKIVDVETAESFDADCIMVLGAQVKNGRPSLMLRDRLDRAIELHFKTGIPLLMSGDRSGDYDEVGVMMAYAIERGVSVDSVMIDPKGYSTFESVTRLEKLGFDSCIVVTQEYHISRALYICEKAGIDAVGVPAENIRYMGHRTRLVREVIARSKDFIFTLFI